MKYVALLRGINVGGNNKISMAELKACFEKLGFKQVKTYINSGNIIFDASEPEKTLVPKIEQCIRDNFHLDVPVVIRSQQKINSTVRKIPGDWVNDQVMRTDVMFLWDEVDRPDVLEEIKINPEVDHLIYIPGAVIWQIDRTNYTKSHLNKFIGTRVYKLMTARNANTVRKLQELMRVAQDVIIAKRKKMMGGLHGKVAINA